MQGEDTQKGNVISLFETKKSAAEAESADAKSDGAKAGESFMDVMKQNAKNKERLEKERLTANKSVLRTYRIKH